MATYVYTAGYSTIYPNIPLTAHASGPLGAATVWDWPTPPTDGRWAPTNAAVNQSADNGGPGNPGGAPAITATTPGIYIPPSWGQSWKAARNNAGSAPARIACVGGSSTAGYYASNLRTKGWVDLVRTSLQAAYGDGGDGFYASSLSSVFQASVTISAGAQTAYGPNLVALTGSWSQGGSDYGPGVSYIFCSAAATATWTVRGTSVSIYTVDGGNPVHANWTYQIDGGAAVPVTDGGVATQSIRKTTINGLTAGAHSVRINYNGTSAFLSVCGVSGENSTGIVVNNFARYGSRSANYSGFSVSNDQTINTAWNGGPSYPADLVILTHGPNDANNNDAGDVWSKNMRKIMSYIRDGGTATGNTDLMIMLPHIGTFDTTNYLYQDYAERARGLAEAYNAVLVNMWTIGRNSWNYWNNLGYWSNSSNPGIAGTDSVHPSDAGYAAIANVITPILAAT